MAGSYNGHPSWSKWNVSLWINNDEGLYNHARDYCRRFNRKKAAECMLADLKSLSISKTPDGANYTVSSIMHAMRGM